jgi:hypothetical protein
MVEGNAEGARGLHSFGNFTQKHNCDSGDALAFEFGCDQTHGLVAHGSDGCKQGDIDGIFFEQGRGLRGGFGAERSGSNDRSHAGEMTVVDRADEFFRGQFMGTSDRKRQIGIFTNAGVVEGAAAMIFMQGAKINIIGNDAEAGVAAFYGFVERLLIGSGKARAAYQAKAALVQGLFEWSPWDGIDLSPWVSFNEKPNRKAEIIHVGHVAQN